MIEEKRLKPIASEKGSNYKYNIIGYPKDLAAAENLAKDNKYKFEQ